MPAPAGVGARFQTGRVDNPGAKLITLSWTSGGDCKNMLDIINRSGYNLVILQDAQEAWQRRFPAWESAIERNQLFAARKPVPMAHLLA